MYIARLIIVIFSVIVAADSVGCECWGPGPSEEQYRKYDNVVLGRVTGLDRRGEAYAWHADMQILESFKGSQDKFIKVRSDNCSGPFELNSQYLVFWQNGDEPHIHGLCGPSKNTKVFEKEELDNLLNLFRNIKEQE